MEGRDMKKHLLITAAAVTACLAASGAGASAASAGTTIEFCVPGYNTCFTWPQYPANMTIPINPNPYTTYPLKVTGSWSSPTSAAAGTYTVAGKREAVSDITLGAPVIGNPSWEQYTCLSFKVNATRATVYAAETVFTDGWRVVTSDCM
jgi:hypothetical protein